MTLKPSKAVELLVKNIGKKTNIEFTDVINLASLIIADVASQHNVSIPIKVSNRLNHFYGVSLLIDGKGEESFPKAYQTFNDMFDESSEHSLYSLFKFLRDELNLEFYSVSFNTYFEEMEPLANLRLVTMVRRQNY
jgi:hypothetical protein